MSAPDIATSDKVNFGQPHLVGYGIGTGAIFDRFMVGESIAFMAEDYGIPASAIETAIRFEAAQP